ncbi:MAG: hypothetical protein COA32_13685 [Fluviicola sp.]|nr:MAG: hypothetical protein COA32_13685 [Fluviicola sp.]
MKTKLKARIMVSKNLIFMINLLLFTALACVNEEQIDENNFDEFRRGLKKKKAAVKENKRKFENYVRPVLVDTAVFFFDGENPKEKHYHINAYSKIDTANIEFYTNWYDSTLNEFKGGRESIVYFFNNKPSTPKISFPTLVSDKAYEEHCFLFIKYERGALKYYWNPFKNRKQK